MEISPPIQIVVFAFLSLVAIGGALGMTTTMSMFRSGILLMASFCGVAGLFILLLADLLGVLQVMMYIGGMLVMILFMVLFSQDPGGTMMTGMMDLPPIEKLFSLGLAHKGGDGENREQMGSVHTSEHDDSESTAGSKEHKNGHGMDVQMDMAAMSMTTPIKKPAIVISAVNGALLLAMIFLRPAWRISAALPDPDSPKQIGSLLMGKYMMAFEGAGLMILLGIFAAVYLSRPDEHPGPKDRDHLRAASAETPVAVAADSLQSASPLERSSHNGESS